MNIRNKMIKIYPDQLEKIIKESLFNRYFLFGNDLFLLQESQDKIISQTKIKIFNEHYIAFLNVNTDWDAIFSFCCTTSLFSARKTLLLIVSENIDLSSLIDKFVYLFSLLNKDIIFIFRGMKLTRTQENSKWFKALSHNSIVIICETPEGNQLLNWANNYAKRINLTLNDESFKILCSCYEGNLLAMSQALERLLLIYPKENPTLIQVKLAINNDANFNLFNWIDAILDGNSKRAYHILQNLYIESIEPVILLRVIQKEVLFLLYVKREYQIETNQIRILLIQHKIWGNRKLLLERILKKLSLSQINQAVFLIKKIELTIKKDFNNLVWCDLKLLTFLLCGNIVPEVMIHSY